MKLIKMTNIYALFLSNLLFYHKAIVKEANCMKEWQKTEVSVKTKPGKYLLKWFAW